MEKNVLIGITKAEIGYIASAPDFPGCLASGTTPEEAKQNMVDILSNQMRALLEKGMALPPGADYYTVASVPVTGISRDAICGTYLKAYRKKLGLTQAELADRLEVTKETISEWERDRRDLPGAVKFALESVTL